MANAANRKQIESASRIEKGIRNSELADVRHVMQDVRGRSLVYRLLQQTGVEVPLPWSPNAMTLARDAGIQSVGYWLLAEIRAACPEQELIMRREAAAQAQRADMQEELDDDNRRD